MKKEENKVKGDKIVENGNSKGMIVPLKTLIYSILSICSVSLLVMSCGTTPRRIMTEPLYMQYKNVKLELPPGDEIGDSQSSGGMLSEIVNYTNKEDNGKPDKEKKYSSSDKLDANAVYRLNEVVVTSRSSFTPERDGRVAVNFMVRVPKELISSNWSLTLTPELLHNDSIVPLKDIIIKGEEFYNKQLGGYEAYDEYLASIIDKKDYDSVFLDRDGISKDLFERQSLFLNLYKSEWDDMMNYQQWKDLMEGRYMKFNVKQEVNRRNLWHQIKEKLNTIK